jgi:hypothetical protein
MIRTAYFRTYLPSKALAGLPPHRVESRETRLVQSDSFIWDESLADDGIYTVWQGTQFVCPRNVRLRMVEGILAFTKTYPMLPLLSESDRLEYVAELARLRKRSTHSRGYILSSPWHVPLRWFSAFRQNERETYEGPEGLSIRYRTSLGEAIDRIHWTAGVLDSAGFSEQVIERVNDLERWMAEFGPESMIELDYALVARTFSDADLALDDSVDDIRTSLLALESGDYEESQDAYEKVARRWAVAQAYTFSN